MWHTIRQFLNVPGNEVVLNNSCNTGPEWMEQTKEPVVEIMDSGTFVPKTNDLGVYIHTGNKPWVCCCKSKLAIIPLAIFPGKATHPAVSLGQHSILS